MPCLPHARPAMLKVGEKILQPYKKLGYLGLYYKFFMDSWDHDLMLSSITTVETLAIKVSARMAFC